MKTGIGSNTGKSAKSLAQQIAKQMAREPFEVLKAAREQTTGVETSEPTQNQSQDAAQVEQQKKMEEQQKKQDNMKSQRLYEALQREITDIEHQDLFHSLQSKIAEGQEISLTEYPELTMEQKEVLDAQMKAVKEQKAQAQARAAEGAPAVSSKPSRRFGSTRKQEAEKQQQRVEKPVPPSG